MLNKLGKLRTFLDMDEVLVDFAGSAMKVHGYTGPDPRTGSWDLVPKMGLTTKQFWDVINSHGEEFWATLQPLPWIDKLISFVETISTEWHIVSAPSLSEASYTGKVKWLKSHFGNSFDRFLLTPHKHLFANEGSLLIDDREKNIDDFIAAGGWGLIFPSPGNQLHMFSKDPVKYLSSIWSSNGTP